MQQTKTHRDAFCVVFQLWLLSFLADASLTNFARNGTAVQSTSYLIYHAQRAIDGNRNPTWSDGSCSHTDLQSNPWWRLSLMGVYRISNIKITNRDEISERLNGAEILIGNSADNDGNTNPRCAVISSIPSGQTSTFQCGGMEGRFVNVYIPGAEKILTLCEVEVYGEEVPAPPIITAVVGQRHVTVVGKKLCWSDALFYCRDFYWDLLTLRSLQEQREVEEVLGSASFPLTELLWLGLRRYLMDGKWFWMSGESLNFTHWEERTIAWQVTSPCGCMTPNKKFLWRDQSCGDHVHFICLTDPQEGAKRVEFFSSYRGNVKRNGLNSFDSDSADTPRKT